MSNKNFNRRQVLTALGATSAGLYWPGQAIAQAGAWPTSDPDTVIIESHGGGPTVDGGVYTQ